MHNFDELLNRRNTNTWKWDGEGLGADYPMGTADMDFKMPEEISKAMKDKIDQGVLSYAADKTYVTKAFADYQNKRYGLDIDYKDVYSGTALMAVYKILIEAYTAPGDGVIVQTPTFGHLYNVPRNNGRMLYENRLVYNEETHEWSVNFEQLENYVKDPRVKMLVVCNPGNPVTKAFTKEEMKKMYDLCNENDVVLLSDEIHSDVYYDGRKHVSIFSVCGSEKHNCIILTSQGKVFGIPGLKTAFVVIHDPKLKKRWDVVSNNCRVDVVDLSLVAAEAGYKHAFNYIEELGNYLQKNKDTVVNFFNNNGIKVGLTKPEASYLFWLDFRKWNLTNDKLEELLKKYGIVYSNGVEFGPGNEGFMRMNVATTNAQVAGALEALKKCYEENIK